MAGRRPEVPFGVVDIGSNSVRLVIYRGLSRAPEPLFNEKAMCGIGRSLATTGTLDETGVMRALMALGRFRALAEGMGVGEMTVVATAAARDADNGAAFLEAAEKEVGRPIRLLTGAEEAHLAALGVVSGTPDADGLVGDLGGGSLELTPVENGVVKPGITLPLGPLRLLEIGSDDMNAVRAAIDKTLEEVPWLKARAGQSFYAVGGAWRNLARLHLANTRYPLHILHHYAVPGREARDFATFLSHQSRRSMERIVSISRRRLELMPYAACVLERVLRVTRVRSFVISAYGLREGVLYERLAPEEQAKDPLLEAARDWAERQARAPALAEELDAWMAPLFPEDPPRRRRLRCAMARLSDIGWRVHPDYRADRAFDDVLTAPFAGITHDERAALALAVYTRYAGEDDPLGFDRYRALLDEGAVQWARRLGLACRLGYAITGGSAGLLSGYHLSCTDNRLVVSTPPAKSVLFDDRVQRYLGGLADLVGLKPQILERD